MNLEGRPREIFVIVVGEFIKSAKPIGSEFLAENYRFVPLRGISRRERVSPATIRNELAFLEELGFLTKPHTSGGRIPTANGLHYFIEETWNPPQSTGDEALRLRNSISNLMRASSEVKECVSKFFPDASEEFLRKFLINKIFNPPSHKASEDK